MKCSDVYLLCFPCAVQTSSAAHMEKAEMLGFCQEVLRKLHNLLEETPEMMQRLRAFQRRHDLTRVPDVTGTPSTTKTDNTVSAYTTKRTCKETHMVSRRCEVGATSVPTLICQSDSHDSGVHDSSGYASTPSCCKKSISVDVRNSLEPSRRHYEIWRPYL